MIITDPNGSTILFSRSCLDLTISGIAESCREVSIKITCGQVFNYVATPFSGKVILHLGEILRGLEESLVNLTDINGIQTCYAHKIVIQVSDGGSSLTWQGFYVPGGSQLSPSLLGELRDGKYWWSFRKQTAVTFKFSKELLVSAINSSQSVSIKVTFHFANAGKVSRVWHSGLTSSQSNPTLMIVDCSYRRIKEYADSLGYVNDTIIAYDVTGVAAAEGWPIGQRFVVGPNDARVRGWCFRNSLGGYDTVHSFGGLTRSVDSETKLFASGRSTTELENYSKEIWSVNTGYIGDKATLELWYEFLRSTERYTILEDGSLSKILVDDNESESQLGKLGNLSFKCRFAKEIEGYDFTKSVLEDFSDEYT